MKKKRKHKKHWYRIEYSECVLCGKYDLDRERVYGNKPKDYIPEYRQYACCSHFI